MLRLTSLVSFCCILTLADTVAAAPMYQWRDAQGGLHYSNRTAAIPEGATELTLPPIVSAPPAVVARRNAVATPVITSAARRARAERDACPAPDAHGLAAAVAARLGARELDGLTLIVGGIPIAYDSDTLVQVKGPDPDAPTTAPAEQAAIAYPEGSRCPSRPPLERYPVVAGRRAPSRRLCDDYRRAFAEVGVAVNRDQGVERSFRELAERFVDVAGRGYVAGGRGVVVAEEGALTPVAYAPEDRVPLAPWIVEAHIAQTGELSDESTALVDELTVALEEIDAAARRAGCW